MSVKNTSLYLTRDEYILVLERVAEKIKTADKVRGIDSTTIGDKYTYCNVGLCTDDPEVYTRELNLFPDQYPGRVSSKYRDHDDGEQYCPLSRGHRIMGCFYDCIIFQDKVEDLEVISSLFVSRLKELETTEGGKP